MKNHHHQEWKEVMENQFIRRTIDDSEYNNSNSNNNRTISGGSNATNTTTKTTGSTTSNTEYTMTLYRFAVNRIGYVSFATIDQTKIYLDNQTIMGVIGGNDDTICMEEEEEEFDNPTVNNNANHSSSSTNTSNPNTTGNDDGIVQIDVDSYEISTFRVMIASELLVQQTLCRQPTTSTISDTDTANTNKDGTTMMIPIPDYMTEQLSLMATDRYRISGYFYRSNGLLLMIPPNDIVSIIATTTNTTTTNNSTKTTATDQSQYQSLSPLTELLQNMNCTIDTILTNVQLLNERTSGFVVVSHILIPEDATSFLYKTTTTVNPSISYSSGNNMSTGTTNSSHRNSTNNNCTTSTSTSTNEKNNNNNNNNNEDKDNDTDNNNDNYFSSIRVVHVPMDFYINLYDTVQNSNVQESYKTYMGDIRSDWNYYIELLCTDGTIPECVMNSNNNNNPSSISNKNNTKNNDSIPVFAVVMILFIVFIFQIIIISFVQKLFKKRQLYNIEMQRERQRQIQNQERRDERQRADQQLMSDLADAENAYVDIDINMVVTKDEFNAFPRIPFHAAATLPTTKTLVTSSSSKNNNIIGIEDQDNEIDYNISTNNNSNNLNTSTNDNVNENENKNENKNKYNSNYSTNIENDCNDNNNSVCCSICVEEFKENEIILVLPKCNHIYHVHCIEEWILERQSTFCPLCKVTVKENHSATT